ncbi:3-isopropylmalate dehydratase large subunit [Pseudonocardia sp. GCM10023141]|uniref:3-isopropylmalate dehydratase large subunit n=1 Tax=Pseudonocardia sp. GCM10023141 TaxID=3252653 RepID=UPI0036091E07
MGMTIIEKILARAASVESVGPGDIVVCEVDRIAVLDHHFLTKSEPLPRRINHPDRAVFIMDHGSPAGSVGDAIAHQTARKVARQFGIDAFYDVGRHGIVHQVILENALGLPGTVLACSDSHTCASGALNCAARGVGRAEALSILCTGRTWFKVGPTVRYEFVGALPPGSYGKDVFLHIADRYGDHSNQNLEFAGPGLPGLAMDDRATIATMAAELSAEFATFPFDEVTAEWVNGRTTRAFAPVAPDPDAQYADIRVVDLSTIPPYVSRPDFVPHNTVPVELLEATAIDQAFVGSCSNGKLNDLRVAAAVVRGRQVRAGVRFIVTPASQQVFLEATRAGYVQTLVEAGAVVTQSMCGGCFGYHSGALAPGETCVTSSTRNFKGRMGSADAAIYIASSATVAASAIAGHIVDPRPYLAAARAAGDIDEEG